MNARIEKVRRYPRQSLQWERKPRLDEVDKLIISGSCFMVAVFLVVWFLVTNGWLPGEDGRRHRASQTVLDKPPVEVRP